MPSTATRKRSCLRSSRLRASHHDDDDKVAVEFGIALDNAHGTVRPAVANVNHVDRCGWALIGAVVALRCRRADNAGLASVAVHAHRQGEPMLNAAQNRILSPASAARLVRRRRTQPDDIAAR